MKAMVFAAGLGTRLRPLTDDRPKALVELAGRTLLERVLRRLGEAGFDEVIVNVHHFAEKIAACLEAHQNFGLRVILSHEETLLDTGGGLKQAAWFFTGDEPFLIHNVDVLSNIDLGALTRSHLDVNALATLAVQERKSSRQLLFDSHGLLCGRQSPDKIEWARQASAPQPLAFSGIHIVSPRLLERMSETGVFSIIPTYLRLAAEGERIVAFRADDYYWRDLGKPESLAQAGQDLVGGAYPGL